MFNQTFPIDSIGSVDQKLNYISHSIDNISSNTYAFDSFFSTFNTLCALVASLVTIAGLIILLLELSKRWTSREWQKRIILDLFRHFMVNNAIIEIIRSKTEDMPSTYHPIEGVLSRFATLDSDTELARFSVKKKNYEKIHDLSLKIRNYNNYVSVMDKHLCDSRYPREAKVRELADVFKRSIIITNELMKLCKLQKVKLTSDTIHNYIEKDCYCAEKIKQWKQKGEYCEDFNVLIRNGFAEHSFYDDYGLTESLNHLIRHQAVLIPFIDY